MVRLEHGNGSVLPIVGQGSWGGWESQTGPVPRITSLLIAGVGGLKPDCAYCFYLDRRIRTPLPGGG
jgi:hypothetical protein